MQGVSGATPISPSPDKSRVLDVKPLRVLKPVFPAEGQAPNFVNAPPSCPFPHGYSPAFPFSAPHASEPPAAPTPLRSFRTPESANPIPNGNIVVSPGSETRKRAGRATKSAQKKLKGSDSPIPVSQSFISPISSLDQEDGNREVVVLVCMAYDALRRRLSQLEDVRGATGLSKRADLKAANIILTKGFRTNMKKRIGSVPGVEVGDIFFFRMELCVVGLHFPSMAGIDYMTVRGNGEEEPAAISIVSSGYYDDDDGDKDVLIYSGQGGGHTNLDKEASDQKLERGNLALERSLRRGNEVRVTRGLKDGTTVSSKVYVYDGLYTVQESWVEKAKHGGNIFKYKLVRVPGQPAAFAVWNSIMKWKEGVATRGGLILPDLTSGAESTPVTLVNEVDDEKGPGYFTYFPSVRFSKMYDLQSSHSCKCSTSCSPGDLNCSCTEVNGDFPYTANGILVGRKPLLYECGPSCKCPSSCKNRVSQSGLKIRLEVFKTKNKGWALRSWDPIRAGTFICVYAGEVIDNARLKQKIQEGDVDEYIFDTSRVYNSFKWNEPGLLELESPHDQSEVFNLPTPLVISAKTFGNVARFMNHGCHPNVLWQPVVYEDNNQSVVHIAFYAMRHIPPMTELTYDYGVVSNEGDISSSNFRKKKCMCGYAKCRGYFGL